MAVLDAFGVLLWVALIALSWSLAAARDRRPWLWAVITAIGVWFAPVLLLILGPSPNSSKEFNRKVVRSNAMSTFAGMDGSKVIVEGGSLLIKRRFGGDEEIRLGSTDSIEISRSTSMLFRPCWVITIDRGIAHQVQVSTRTIAEAIRESALSDL